jgi:hypothetical protein
MSAGADGNHAAADAIMLAPVAEPQVALVA